MLLPKLRYINYNLSNEVKLTVKINVAGFSVKTITD